jgi:hypothetical protein
METSSRVQSRLKLVDLLKRQLWRRGFISSGDAHFGSTKRGAPLGCSRERARQLSARLLWGLMLGSRAALYF